MTFHEYLMTRRITKTSAGDFTEDSRSMFVEKLPDEWPRIKLALLRQNACPEAITTGYEIWRQWKKKHFVVEPI